MNTGKSMSIICATDFSAPSQAALDAALDVAKQLGATRLHLLHVDETIERFAAATDAEARFAMEYGRLQDEARTLVSTIARESGERSGLEVVPEFRVGSAYLEVVQYATEVHADLIVVGTHGRTGLKRAFMGSVAERIVRHAACSVLAVKEKAPPAA